MFAFSGELEMVELRKNLHEAESMTRDREHDGSNLLQQLHQYKQQLHGLDEQLLTVQDEAVQVGRGFCEGPRTILVETIVSAMCIAGAVANVSDL